MRCLACGFFLLVAGFWAWGFWTASRELEAAPVAPALKTRVQRILWVWYGSAIVLPVLLALIQWASGETTVLLYLDRGRNRPDVLLFVGLIYAYLAVSIGGAWRPGVIESLRESGFLPHMAGLSPTGTRILLTIIGLGVALALTNTFVGTAPRP